MKHRVLKRFLKQGISKDLTNHTQLKANKDLRES